MADTQNPPSRDEHWMAIALQQAHQASSRGEVPVGAVIVRDDTLVSAAHNLRESLADPTAHAELLAIRHAATQLRSWRLENCTLFVTLEPCPMCAGAIVNARLPRVVYGAADPKMGCVDTLHKLCTDERFNHRVSVTSGVLAEPCGQVLRDFFIARRGSVKPPKPGS
jgi:tRNA(adenine34) deaminase